MNRKEHEEVLVKIKKSESQFFNKLNKMVELCKTAYLLYQSSIFGEKRDFVLNIGSNFILEGKKLMFSMQSLFKEVTNRSEFSQCAEGGN